MTPQFHETFYGKRFFECQLPELTNSIKELSERLKPEEKEPASQGCTRFTVEVEMQDRWIPYFISMLKQMEYLGHIGATQKLIFVSDGDGDFRPKFKPSIVCEHIEPLRIDQNSIYYDAG